MPNPMTTLRAPNADTERALRLQQRNLNTLREYKKLEATQGWEAAGNYLASPNGFGVEAPLTKDGDDNIPEMFIPTGAARALGGAVSKAAEKGAMSLLRRARGHLDPIPAPFWAPSAAGRPDSPGPVIPDDEFRAMAAAREAKLEADFIADQARAEAAMANEAQTPWSDLADMPPPGPEMPITVPPPRGRRR